MKLKVRLFGKNIFTDNNVYSKKARLEDYYKFKVFCKNCRMETIINVKKGVHINDVVNSVKCHYCECRLEKQEIK